MLILNMSTQRRVKGCPLKRDRCAMKISGLSVVATINVGLWLKVTSWLFVAAEFCLIGLLMMTLLNPSTISHPERIVWSTLDLLKNVIWRIYTQPHVSVCHIKHLNCHSLRKYCVKTHTGIVIYDNFHRKMSFLHQQMEFFTFLLALFSASNQQLFVFPFICASCGGCCEVFIASCRSFAHEFNVLRLPYRLFVPVLNPITVSSLHCECFVLSLSFPHSKLEQDPRREYSVFFSGLLYLVFLLLQFNTCLGLSSLSSPQFGLLLNDNQTSWPSTENTS